MTATSTTPGSVATSTTVLEPSSSVTAGTEAPGVPGLDSAEPLCQAYGRLLGTAQLLIIEASFAHVEPGVQRAHETVAAGTILVSSAAVRSAWPDELEPERAVVDARVITPLERRAMAAAAALGRAGVIPEQQAALDAAWTGVLSTQDRSDPELSLPSFPPGVDTVVSSAAADLADELTPIAADPTLVRTDVSTPLTDRWLSERCPELANVVVGDAV